MHLCEFIEDCEYNNLTVRILHLLGTEGPSSPKSSKYIRYIYNRVVLENAVVRAAAVTALAKFGASNSSVKTSIQVLLTRCLNDPEDEVRDRTALNLKLLTNETNTGKFIQNGT
jgi:coatomer subunit gamma